MNSSGDRAFCRQKYGRADTIYGSQILLSQDPLMGPIPSTIYDFLGKVFYSYHIEDIVKSHITDNPMKTQLSINLSIIIIRSLFSSSDCSIICCRT